MIVHATVRTMDARQPLAEAVAMSGNWMLAVGLSADIQRLAGPATVCSAGFRTCCLPAAPFPALAAQAGVADFQVGGV